MKDRLWPLAIGVGLLVVVLVNGAFVYVALSHAPIVEPSYTSASRR